MFKKKFSTLSRFATPHKQGGQVSLLFALLMPILILFVGIALDLGWYYLNVSRLQNAADAAAVAGAQSIADSENFSDYKNVALVNQYPGKVSNQYRTDDVYKLTTIENGKNIAEEYAGKNLSGNKDKMVNSWTKNEVESEEPMLYEQGDNLYFVVHLKDKIQHFFLSGWFDDMDAPVTAVAVISKNATLVANAGNEAEITSSGGEMPTSPSIPDIPSISPVPDMPTLPSIINKPGKEWENKLKDIKNENVIVGNWEVQKEYAVVGNPLESDGKTTSFEGHFSYKVYDKAWNHLQDLKNHYYVGDLYRKQTVNILDDVTTDGQITANGIKTYTSTTFGGNGSNVYDTPAALNNNKESTAYNPGKNNRGYPYLGERVDSLNIDFKPELIFSGKWLSEDWDLTLDDKDLLGDSAWNDVTVKNDTKDWGSTPADKVNKVKRLRIHSSLNLDGAYKVRTNKEFLEKDKITKEALPDILYMRIESEPMLNHPDLINSEIKKKYGGIGRINKGGGITNLNSINQIIINVNASNTADDERPVVIFYDGPETNDVYETESNKKHIRDSLPVILNLNKPFRGVLYAPNSPVVIIGDAKDNFRGFVVAKKYMRLKDESDFTFDGYTNREDLSIYGLRTYHDSSGKVCYKITDENGIEMFVDERGDIQFADYDSVHTAPTSYGKYDNFDRTEFSTEAYTVLKSSASNMLLSSEE